MKHLYNYFWKSTFLLVIILGINNQSSAQLPPIYKDSLNLIGFWGKWNSFNYEASAIKTNGEPFKSEVHPYASYGTKYSTGYRNTFKQVFPYNPLNPSNAFLTGHNSFFCDTDLLVNNNCVFGGTNIEIVDPLTITQNLKPIANNDFGRIENNVPAKFNLLANDFDKNGDKLKMSFIINNSVNMAVNIGANYVEINPASTYIGLDSFQYVVCDSSSLLPTTLCDTAYVFLMISPIEYKEKPAATDDFIYTTPGTTVILNPLRNDYDSNGDSLKIISTWPTIYPVSAANQSIAYTASTTNLAWDTLYYTVCDWDFATTLNPYYFCDTGAIYVRTKQPLAVNWSSTNPSCFGGSNGSITANVPNGTSPFYYQWSNGANTQTISNLVAGTYSVTVRDAEGDIVIGTKVITAPPALSVSDSETPVSCFGGNNGSATLTATGGTPPLNFLWSSASCGNSNICNSLTVGNHTVTVSDANSCSVVVNVSISQPAMLEIQTMASNDVTCFGGNNGGISFQGAGGVGPYSFVWSASTGCTNNFWCNGLSAGTYTVTMSDANSCTATSTFTVSQPNQIQINATSQTNVSCFGGNNGSLQVQGSGGTGAFTYTWPTSTACNNSSICSSLSAGNYIVTASDGNGCQNTKLFTITEPSPLGVSFTILNNVSCPNTADGSLSTSATGGTPSYTFTWNSQLPCQSSPCNNLPQGLYTVTVTDALNCTATNSINLSAINPLPTVDILSTTINVCESENAITLDGTPIGGAFSGTGVSLGQFDPMSSGAGIFDIVYSYQGPGGCWAHDTAQAVVNENPSPSGVNSTNTLTCGGNEGSFTIIGLSPNKLYNINYLDNLANPISNSITSNNAGELSVSALILGNYTNILISEGNCQSSTPLNTSITGPTPPSIVNGIVTNVSCNGFADGMIDLQLQGTGAYEFTWNNGLPDLQNINGLSPGYYEVTVTDINTLCSDTANYSVSEPSVLVANAGNDAILCFESTVTLGGNPTASGGVGNYSYTWTGSVNNATLSNPQIDFPTGLLQNLFVVQVMDDNGCIATDQVSITIDSIHVSINPILPCANTPEMYSFTASSSIGASMINHVWTFENTTTSTFTNPLYEFLAPGSYEVRLTVTDLAGCTQSDTIIVEATDCVWPGDADANGLADNYDLLAIGLGYNETGATRGSVSNTWTNQYSLNWPQQIPLGPNMKHADCNGDGIVNVADTVAISQNFMLTHGKNDDPSENRAGLPYLRVVLEKDTFNHGDTLIASLQLGNVNEVVNDIYGIAFTMNYNSEIVDITKTRVEYSNSFLGDVSNKIGLHKDLPGQNKIKMGFTRIDHNNVSGYGEIAKVFFVITTDNIDGKDLVTYLPMVITFSGLKAIMSNGILVTVNNDVAPFVLGVEIDSTNSIQTAQKELAVVLYPNPANDRFTVQSSQNIQKIEITDINGKLMGEWMGDRKSITIGTQVLESGIYYVRIMSEGKTKTEKLSIIR